LSADAKEGRNKLTLAAYESYIWLNAGWNLKKVSFLWSFKLTCLDTDSHYDDLGSIISYSHSSSLYNYRCLFIANILPFPINQCTYISFWNGVNERKYTSFLLCFYFHTNLVFPVNNSCIIPKFIFFSSMLYLVVSPHPYPKNCGTYAGLFLLGGKRTDIFRILFY
jgi:hypothetical protein